MLMKKVIGFDWDSGNLRKNEKKHCVTDREPEEIFFNKPIIIAHDLLHSTHEKRFSALGITSAKRLLNIVFTMRHNRIRVISARPMSKKERIIYEKEKKKNTKF